MPTSIDPLPKDDEVECGNCGAYVYHDLVKCPNCGVNLIQYGELDEVQRPAFRPKSKFALWLESMWRNLRGKPHVAEELFSDAMQEAALFDDLLKKVGGDRLVVERLIRYEQDQSPGAPRLINLQNAIRRWEKDNS